MECAKFGVFSHMASREVAAAGKVYSATRETSLAWAI